MIIKPRGSVNIPRHPRSGLDVLSWCRDANRTFQQLRDRVFEVTRSSKASSKALPFEVKLHTTDEGTYEVSSGGWGYVNERVTGEGNATPTPHEPANRDDEEADPIVPKKFPITVGQAFYVRVEVGVDGKIVAPSGGDAVKFEVSADDAESVHYQPEAGDETATGVAGHYMYKLAVLKAPVEPSTTPKLEKWLAGSHIDHFSELPKIKNALSPGEGIGTIAKEWRDDENAYKLRAVAKGLGQANIQNVGDYVEVRGTKKDADIYVWEGQLRPSDPTYSSRDGYVTTGTEVIGDEEEPPDLTPINIKVPTVEAGDGITVENIATDAGPGLGKGLQYKVSATGSHQWKVTENGDTTMNVAAGSVMSILGEASPGLGNVPAWTQWKEYDYYAGGTVTGITTDGVIYGEVDYTAASETIFEADMADGLTIDRVTPATSGVTVSFAASLPTSGTGVFYFEIAKVASTGTVATKTRQILEGPTPPLWLIDIPPGTEPPP